MNRVIRAYASLYTAADSRFGSSVRKQLDSYGVAAIMAGLYLPLMQHYVDKDPFEKSFLPNLSLFVTVALAYALVCFSIGFGQDVTKALLRCSWPPPAKVLAQAAVAAAGYGTFFFLADLTLPDFGLLGDYLGIVLFLSLFLGTTFLMGVPLLIYNCFAGGRLIRYLEDKT